jgi:hypothetical protein
MGEGDISSTTAQDRIITRSINWIGFWNCHVWKPIDRCDNFPVQGANTGSP